MNRRIVLLVMLLAGLLVTACGGEEYTGEERDMLNVVQGFEAALNEQDYQKASEYLAEDVLFYTPPGGLIEGREAWLESSVDTANPVTFESENFEVYRDEVAWDTVVYSEQFVANARIRTRIEDGKIAYYQATER